MNPRQLAIVQGAADTRATLVRWNAAPRAVLVPWVVGSLTVSAGLLLAVFAIASTTTPDPTRYAPAGLYRPVDGDDVLHILLRNSLVLALHAMACIAGYIAGSSLPAQAEQHSGLWRRVHDHAGPAAIAFVLGATAFSLCTQAYVLGSIASTLALQLQISAGTLMLTLLPHALMELVALFLPLAAWTIASRRGAWNELLAATAVTVAIAVPVLIAAAAVEAFVWPQLLRLASPTV